VEVKLSVLTIVLVLFPELDSGGKRHFSINCGEAMMYWFEWRKGQYKFVAVDNVNE
jgi:hypothetical protein